MIPSDSCLPPRDSAETATYTPYVFTVSRTEEKRQASNVRHFSLTWSWPSKEMTVEAFKSDVFVQLLLGEFRALCKGGGRGCFRLECTKREPKLFKLHGDHNWHYQCYLYVGPDVKKRPSQIAETLRAAGLTNIHVQPVSKNAVFSGAAWRYCYNDAKPDNMFVGPAHTTHVLGEDEAFNEKGEVIAKPYDVLSEWKDRTLYPFQRDLETWVNWRFADHNPIVQIYDAEGQSGTTQMFKYLQAAYPSAVLMVNAADRKDMMTITYDHPPMRMYCIDITRMLSKGTSMAEIMSVAESITDGSMMKTKGVNVLRRSQARALVIIKWNSLIDKRLVSAGRMTVYSLHKPTRTLRRISGPSIYFVTKSDVIVKVTDPVMEEDDPEYTRILAEQTSRGVKRKKPSLDDDTETQRSMPGFKPGEIVEVIRKPSSKKIRVAEPDG